MATAGGPKKITDGLVVSFDAANDKSFRGEPTTNLINPDNPNIYSWWTRNVASITQLTETYKGQPIYRVSFSIDNDDMLYHIRERWGAGSGWYMPYAVFNANTPYIASVIYRTVSHSDTRIYGHPSNIGGWGATVDGSTDIDDQWKIHKIDRNFGNTVGDNRFYHMHTASAAIGQVITVDITSSQIEQKSYSTPFVNGTRGTTVATGGGWIDRTGNNNHGELVNNVTFNSSNLGSLVFDGTNQRINLTNFSVSFLTLSTWVFRTSTANNQGICRKENGWAISHYNGFLQLAPGTSWAFYNTGYVIPLNTWVNITYRYSGSGSDSQSVFINGVLIWTNPNGAGSLPTNSNQVRIGFDDNNWWWGGRISQTQIYNRALTDVEVLQNFNATKNRYGL